MDVLNESIIQRVCISKIVLQLSTPLFWHFWHSCWLLDRLRWYGLRILMIMHLTRIVLSKLTASMNSINMKRFPLVQSPNLQARTTLTWRQLVLPYVAGFAATVWLMCPLTYIKQSDTLHKLSRSIASDAANHHALSAVVIRMIASRTNSRLRPGTMPCFSGIQISLFGMKLGNTSI